MQRLFPMRSSRLLQLSFLLLGFSLVSCGIKTPPLPPEEFAPEKITDLQVFTKDKEVILKWLIPAKRVDDTKLLDLAGFEVYRKEQTHTEGEEYIPLYRSASADDQADYLLEEEKAEEIINAKDEPESTQEKNWLDKNETDVQEIKKIRLILRYFPFTRKWVVMKNWKDTSGLTKYC
jgi:predicted small lipoprotein YifL